MLLNMRDRAWKVALWVLGKANLDGADPPRPATGSGTATANPHPTPLKLPWDVVAGMRVTANSLVERGTVQVHPDDLARWRASGYHISEGEN